MKRRLQVCIALFATLAFLISCGSGAQPKAKKGKKEKAAYVSGNQYGAYGRQMDVGQILDSMIESDPTGVTRTVMNFTWPVSKTYWVFTETEGEGEGFYTGPKEKDGPVYTWSAHQESVRSLKEMCEKVSWQKPVYISYENKTIPLTAYVNEEGQLVSAVGENVENPIYVSLDTIKSADIWYCYGMGNAIKNQYYKLSAYSVAIGECAYAQAEANGMLLKDIARLTGAKAGLTETDTDVELTDEDIKAIAEKVAELDDAIKDKIKINKQLTAAIAGAVVGAIKEGVDLAAQIANDAANVAANAMNPAWIAQYIIQAYGPTKEIQDIGKLADKQSKANYKYGSERLKSANELLKKQKAQFDAILAD